MVRIIHFSDFHLNRRFLKDWNDYIKDALISKLKSLGQQFPISLIAFTGDLIDAGGKDIEGAAAGFKLFQKEVILPILDELLLSRNEFLIIPGNHDVVRSNDTKRDELGSLSYFQQDYDNISEFMVNALNKNDFSGFERLKPLS